MADINCMPYPTCDAPRLSRFARIFPFHGLSCPLTGFLDGSRSSAGGWEDLGVWGLVHSRRTLHNHDWDVQTQSFVV